MKTFLISTLSGLFLLILSGLAWVAADNPEAFLRLYEKIHGLFRTLLGIPIFFVAANWLLNVVFLPSTIEKLESSDGEHLEETIAEVLKDSRSIKDIGKALLVLLAILMIGETIFLSLTVISEAMNPEYYKALS